MNLLLEIVLTSGFLLDLFGVIGLGLLALAAFRIAARHPSPCGKLMSCGALALIVGRLLSILLPQFLTPAVRMSLGPDLLGVLQIIPVLLLTGGLAAVVWGLWGHEKLDAAKPSPL